MKNFSFIKIIKVIIFITFHFSFLTFNLVSPVLAQSPEPAISGKPLGSLEGLGPLGEIIKSLGIGSSAPGSSCSVAPASDKLAFVLSATIGIITIVAGIWFLIQLLLAGLNWISSSGDKNKVQEAQHKITNAVIGLTILVAAYAITNLMGKILGINDFMNITAILCNLNIGK